VLEVERLLWGIITALIIFLLASLLGVFYLLHYALGDQELGIWVLPTHGVTISQVSLEPNGVGTDSYLVARLEEHKLYRLYIDFCALTSVVSIQIHTDLPILHFIKPRGNTVVMGAEELWLAYDTDLDFSITLSFYPHPDTRTLIVLLEVGRK